MRRAEGIGSSATHPEAGGPCLQASRPKYRIKKRKIQNKLGLQGGGSENRPIHSNTRERTGLQKLPPVTSETYRQWERQKKGGP